MIVISGSGRLIVSVRSAVIRFRLNPPNILATPSRGDLWSNTLTLRRVYTWCSELASARPSPANNAHVRSSTVSPAWC